MKDRESHIEFDRNYCTHYKPRPGAGTYCDAGLDTQKLQRVATKPNGIKCGPCIKGHTLDNPQSFCPKWERRSLEHAEKRADDIEKSLRRMLLISPVVSEWRVNHERKTASNPTAFSWR